MQTKAQIRAEITRKKKQHTQEELGLLSAQVWNQLENHPLFQSARTVLLYYSLPDEVQTHAFVEKWSKKKTIILPVVKGNELELREYTGKANLKPGNFHIEEPVGKAITNPDAINLALIPGISFDRQGNRLGRGKGYYDRLLQKDSLYKIGICFQFQLRETPLPADDWDKPMDEVWTENGRMY
jgi:5-formyltetrahydrofolate cyclo-ligase